MWEVCPCPSVLSPPASWPHGLSPVLDSARNLPVRQWKIGAVPTLARHKGPSQKERLPSPNPLLFLPAVCRVTRFSKYLPNPLNHLQPPISDSTPPTCYLFFMSTPIQTAANRLNAQHSTGPRSAQGKAASRANSLKTGLYARSQVIAGEDPAELRALADQYFLRWDPTTPEESFLVPALVSDWLLRRYSPANAKIWDYRGGNDSVRDNPTGKGLNFIPCREYFPLLQRRIDALHDLERLQSKRCATPQQHAT